MHQRGTRGFKGVVPATSSVEEERNARCQHRCVDSQQREAWNARPRWGLLEEIER